MSDETKFVVEEVKEDYSDEKKSGTHDFTPDPSKEKVKQECFSRLNINTDGHSQEETIKSTNFITNFMDFIKSKRFFASCDEVARKKGVTQKQVAKNFFEHVLGTVSDVLHIVIDTVQDVVRTTLEILGKVLGAGASLICNVARRLVRVVTLNKTCVA